MSKEGIKPGTIRTREVGELNDSQTVRSETLITTVQVRWALGHAHVHVWNRGGKAGTPVVDLEDGEKIAELLLPEGRWVEP